MEEAEWNVNSRKIEKPYVTVDLIVFTIKEKNLMALLIKRNVPPFKGQWALPGGFFSLDDSLEEATKKKLFDETGVHDVYLEQLYTFGEPRRDPRGRVITVAYFALINSENVKVESHVSDVKEAKWFPMKSLPRLAFDHKNILDYALKRLRWKIEYTTVAYSLLPEYFTLGSLQHVYEIILGRKLDKRNFRKKILSLGILADSRKIKMDVSHRPAKLYAFKRKTLEFIDIL